MFGSIALHILLTINAVYGGILILSSKQTEISGLKPFDETSFQSLRDNFKKAKIVSFKLNSERIPLECENILQRKFTSYVPTITYEPENLIILDQDDKKNCATIKKKIHVLDLENQKNIIYLIIHESIKVKREIDEIEMMSSSTMTSYVTSTDEPVTSAISKIVNREKIYVNPEDKVIYYAEGKAMLYSSRAPILQVQNDTIYELGPAAVVTVDERDLYLRLICNIPVENGKISLRFRFPKENGYWFLTSVEIEDVELKTYNLTITEEIYAPMNFSYRCGGETTFSDPSGTQILTLFDLQVQPKIDKKKFDDAYNCVPFMTGPIWSGIFVSSILGLGLIVGLSALGSIKTMDKFDNSKTKQLTITVIGE